MKSIHQFDGVSMQSQFHVQDVNQIKLLTSAVPRDADASLLGVVEYPLYAHIVLDAGGAQVPTDAEHVRTLHSVAALL